MASHHDGPSSPAFHAVPFKGNVAFTGLANAGASASMQDAAPHAPRGRCISWGMPFDIARPLVTKERAVSVALGKIRAQWLVFMHTTDLESLEWNGDGFLSPMRGIGRLNEHVAEYVLEYADGTEVRAEVRRRHHIGMYCRPWGENCFQAVAHSKPAPMPPVHEQDIEPPFGDRLSYWGKSQTRVNQPDILPWVNWLWAWENPHPEKPIVSLRVEPKGWLVLLSGISAGKARSTPLRWDTRKKAVLTLPKGTTFDPTLNDNGVNAQLALDLGQVISARPRTIYPNESWAKSYNNQVPAVSESEILVEYTAHPDACFHVLGKTIPVAKVDSHSAALISPVPPATRRVELRVVDQASKKPVPVKLHVHGSAGEYLAPVDRPRIPNPAWFEDYTPDFLNRNIHCCTYISGETVIDLPEGPVYIEVSKGFEIQPVRKVVHVTARTKSITIPVQRILPWRERGWVTADTHVHFLSPATAMLEGAAEGVNIINLLASQWGELMTNVGDFDGKTTFGSREAGGDGEWLVRVGTENRQHVLGHISLLGYSGRIIAPMCSGGPDEAALGDPVDVLMTEWARQCRAQGGLVVMPHFPNPRCENVATLLDGHVDAVEMASWGYLYNGIDPYSLSDWYRYLNCGYFHAAVGGTDKMSAHTPVGAIRTYAHVGMEQPFTYETWMDAVRAGRTFVTYGPLLEFRVEGKPSGTRIAMNRTGGTVDVEFDAASVTMPMSRVDLIVNGEIRESRRVAARQAGGHWRVPVTRSSWIAVLVRGHYPGKPEVIAAHTSPVMVEVEGSPFFAAADAMTILEQIEGALAYIDTIGTRAEAKAYKRIRLILTSAHRKLHNELHRRGHGHSHTHTHEHHKR
ncbi:MAG: CehA/McbA family metallohydrolase [Candidatus Hydrogenedentes bacterium]|nr:CehA/McbA family metallohydrolase [Candidatus Hydrogenedentota bacterium]